MPLASNQPRHLSNAFIGRLQASKPESDGTPTVLLPTYTVFEAFKSTSYCECTLISHISAEVSSWAAGSFPEPTHLTYTEQPTAPT